jgi:type IV pilus assembly protein PilB
MQSLILNRGSAQALAEQASSEGVRKLRQAGLLKVLQGLTSAQEGMAMTQHG